MGRRRIVIEEIKDSNKRYVTFTKRRQGLFKKADTASRMYGLQIGVIVFSPTGRLYTSGPVDSVIHQFLHQSSSSSSYSNLEEENVVIDTTTTTTSGDHIEDGKKRSRNGDDDRVPMMMPEEREIKMRKLLMMSTTTTTTTIEAAAATDEGENEEFLLIKNSETEQEGLIMINEFMGFEQNVTTELEEEEEEEVLLGESQISREEEIDYNMGSSSSSTTVVSPTTSQLVASSFLESDHDDELDEVLHGFADYIIADHPYEETTSMFDLLPHQGVYDDDDKGCCFTFCDNWPTI